ncbi:EG45-like domain containing protein, partial [Tanacetum coccineum]
TVCYGNDTSKFPSDSLFAAAGDGIWDNGAACGRKYLVKCISGTEPGACVSDEVIQVTIVDYANTSGPSNYHGSSTMVLSATAFGLIANSTADTISIEFKQKIFGGRTRSKKYCKAKEKEEKDGELNDREEMALHTSKGIWMARCAGIETLAIVADLQGTDGRE